MAAEAPPRAFTPNPLMRGLFAGSGSDAVNDKRICDEIVRLTGKAAEDVRLLYVGTATYDLPGPRERQTARFVEAGCRVTALECTDAVPEDMAAQVEGADVIIISGGNTLFACDRWEKIGVKPLLRAAMDRGVVMAGGSAGAMCWFTAGHSDSNDPDSYKKNMRAAAAAAAAPEGDESSAPPAADEAPKPWKYIRAPALGFIPGLNCPHHDATQSNGVLRATDFDAMMLRHPGERGICIDHWAALVVEGEDYRVISLDGKPGSVLEDGSFSAAREGRPAMWTKDVVDGVVVTRLVPEAGKVADLLLHPAEIVDDPAAAECRAANPDDSGTA